MFAALSRQLGGVYSACCADLLKLVMAKFYEVQVDLGPLTLLEA